jgi:hypothetical protein
LDGERIPGQRVQTAPTLMGPFIGYCRVRLADDLHLWVTFYDELVELGFTGSYPLLTVTIRRLGLQPRFSVLANLFLQFV